MMKERTTEVIILLPRNAARVEAFVFSLFTRGKMCIFNEARVLSISCMLWEEMR